jgi:ABC-type protease/lipase transport system fused ATPase/permease subunit
MQRRQRANYGNERHQETRKHRKVDHGIEVWSRCIFFLRLTQQLYLLSMYDRRQIILLHNNTESEVVQLKRFN